MTVDRGGQTRRGVGWTPVAERQADLAVQMGARRLPCEHGAVEQPARATRGASGHARGPLSTRQHGTPGGRGPHGGRSGGPDGVWPRSASGGRSTPGAYELRLSVHGRHRGSGDVQVGMRGGKGSLPPRHSVKAFFYSSFYQLGAGESDIDRRRRAATAARERLERRAR